MKALFMKKWLSFKSSHTHQSNLSDQLQSTWIELWVSGSDEAASLDIIN